MYAKSIAVASVLAAVASAQVSTSSAPTVAASTTVSQVMPPAATAGFNPANVSSTDAFNWCHAQLNSCPDICGGAASTNTCNQQAFTYSCICADGTVPDCTAYAQTLPYFICQATFSQCINANDNNAMGQSQCTANEKCGSKNATLNLVSSSSSASATITSTSVSSMSAAASGSASAASTSSSHGIATPQQVGTGAFAAVLMAALKLIL